jgi:hypothetical protein
LDWTREKTERIITYLMLRNHHYPPDYWTSAREKSLFTTTIVR